MYMNQRKQIPTRHITDERVYSTMEKNTQTRCLYKRS